MSQKNLLTIQNNKFGENGIFPIESAIFNISVNTERWDENSKIWKYGIGFLSVRYSLEIIVDEDSGEDTAPAPVINNIPVYYYFDRRHPKLEELIGKTIETVDNVWDWDAWFGNDASSLTNNKITFLKWDNNQLYLIWEASFEKKSETIRFEGAAEFEGIEINVKKSGDEDIFIRELFKDNFSGWVKKVGKWTDYGDDTPADRRRWLNIQYIPKEPLLSP